MKKTYAAKTRQQLKIPICSVITRGDEIYQHSKIHCLQKQPPLTCKNSAYQAQNHRIYQLPPTAKINLGQFYPRPQPLLHNTRALCKGNTVSRTG
jgi:hypothetical protein